MYWREAMTKLISDWFLYLGCWSKGQILPEELHDPYIWKQLYLNETSCSSPSAHFQTFNNFLLLEQRSFLKLHMPDWCFSPTWLTAAATAVHSTDHRLSWGHGLSIPFPWQTPPQHLLIYKSPSKHLHCDKFSPCKKEDSKIAHGSLITFRSLGSDFNQRSLVLLWMVSLHTCPLPFDCLWWTVWFVPTYKYHKWIPIPGREVCRMCPAGKWGTLIFGWGVSTEMQPQMETKCWSNCMGTHH